MLDKKIRNGYNIKHPISHFPNVMGNDFKKFKEVTK